MRIKQAIFSLILLHISIYSQYVVKGKLMGSDGLPMARADIVWVGNKESFPRSVIKKFEVNADGTFEFDTRRRGLHRIWFTGVDHKSFRIPFYLDKPDTTIISINLQRLELSSEIRKIILYAGYNTIKNKYNIRDTLYRNEKGTFTKIYKAYADSFKYDLYAEPRLTTIGGSKVDKYVFTCKDWFEEKYNYYYSNVIYTRRGKEFLFEFDPVKLKLGSNKEHYTFLQADMLTKDFLFVHEDYERRWNKYSAYIEEGRKKGIYSNEYANSYTYDQDMEDLQKLIETETDTFMKNAWAMSKFTFAELDAFFHSGKMKISKEQSLEVLNDLPADSPLWSYTPNNIIIALTQAYGKEKKGEFSKKEFQLSAESDPYLNYLLSIFIAHPDSSIKSEVLRWIIGYYNEHDRMDKVLEYMDKFREFDPVEYSRRSLKDRYDPQRNIQTKKKIPVFRFTSINDSSIVKTNVNLLGKKYLIHFWGSWCAPCRTQMHAIQNFNSRFGKKKFEVISVAVDFSKEKVFEFQTKIKMPWFNSFIDQRKDSNNVLRTFAVSYIPKDILVDEKGFILVVDDLEKILEILSKASL